MTEPAPLRWMHVQEYDFNNGTGHFAVPREDVETESGGIWPGEGDEMILADLTPGDRFGCVVTVTRVVPAVRDGWLRYETDLAARVMEKRRRRDGSEL